MQKGVDIERHSGGGVVPAGSWIKFAFKADFSSLLLATKRTGKARTCKENDEQLLVPSLPFCSALGSCERANCQGRYSVRKSPHRISE